MEGMHEAPALLVVDTYRLGDQVYLAAFCEGLRDIVANVKIDVIASTVTRGSGLLDDVVDTVFYINSPWLAPRWVWQPFRLSRAFWEIGRIVCGRSYDYTIFVRGGLLELAMCSAGVGSIVRYGGPFKSACGAIMGYQSGHIYNARMSLLRKVHGTAITRSRWPFLKPLWYGPDAAVEVAISPEASMSAKRWPLEKWVRLAVTLRSAGYRVCLICSSAKAQNALDFKFDRIFVGSIRELRGYLAGVRAVVAVDSFVGHCAAAQGVPVVSLFGATDPEEWRPWGSRTVVVTPRCGHMPKFRRKAIENSGETFMSTIEIEDVWSALCVALES